MTQPMTKERREELRARNKAGRHVSLNEAEELLDEIDRLVAITAGQPTTVDGVMVSVGDVVYHPHSVEPGGMIVGGDGPNPNPHMASNASEGAEVSECYSTEELANAARE